MRSRLLLILAALLLAPTAAWATVIVPCPISTAILPCGSVPYGFGSAGVANYLTNTIFPAVRAGFVAVAVVFFTVYGAKLLGEADEENTVSEIKMAYGNAIAGAVTVCISTFIVDSFGRNAFNATNLVNPAPIAGGISNIILYFKLIVGVLLSILVTTQGIRLILLQGQESEMEQQRKRFLHGLLGVAVILLADVLVGAVVPDWTLVSPTLAIVGNSKAGQLAIQLIGILNFCLVFLMALAVVSLLVAGVFLVVSVDESLKERAKKIIFGTVISLIIILSSYALVNYFLI